MVEEIGAPKEKFLVDYFSKKKKVQGSPLADGQMPFAQVFQLKIDKIDAEGKTSGASSNIDNLDPKSTVAAVRESIDKLKNFNL